MTLPLSSLTLGTLVMPHSESEFLSSIWTKQFIHSAGESSRFAHLFSWESLAQVLEEHRLDRPRLQLFRGGKPVDHRFVSYSAERRVPRLRADALAAALGEGSMLVVNDIEDAHKPLRTLVEQLENVFRVPINSNVYAGWGTDRGFDVHWDDQDVFILQIAGRKHWCVSPPNTPYPVRETVSSRPPNDLATTWEATITPGTVLYIPRGWWHLALPVGEPTLHITITIRNFLGADFLRWLSTKVITQLPFRQDVPSWDDSATRACFLQSLRTCMEQMWTNDLLEEFVETQYQSTLSRPQVSFPGVMLDQNKQRATVSAKGATSASIPVGP